MKSLLLVPIACLIVGCANPSAANKNAPAPSQEGAKQITFKATDGNTVFADLYSAPDHTSSLVLMFHQAGSNSGEYAQISPRVAKWGFDCLAVNLRNGDDMFPSGNPTAKQYKGTPTYLEAYNDMSGALQWAESQQYQTIVAWGSSYSASLVFNLASENAGPSQKLKALVSFSPGEYFDDKNLVKSWARLVQMPVFFACTPEEMPQGRIDIYNALARNPRSLIQAIDGSVHGSSTLLPEKAPKAAPLYWKTLEAFLQPFASGVKEIPIQPAAGDKPRIVPNHRPR